MKKCKTCVIGRHLEWTIAIIFSTVIDTVMFYMIIFQLIVLKYSNAFCSRININWKRINGSAMLM